MTHGSDLRADCSQCVALCCAAPAFAKSADFAITKPPGRPCPNLGIDHRCGIHTELRSRGFGGCVAFDCLGAGPKVTQVVFGGRDWRASPEIAGEMFDVFAVVRPLHELLWYLTAALELEPAGAFHGELRARRESVSRLTRSSPGELLGVDVGTHRAPIAHLLSRVSQAVRADFRARQPHSGGRARRVPGRDLIGARWAGADLSAVDLRGALLIGADLRGADLRAADLLGADLRGADVRGADLREALFLTPPQVSAMIGDAHTRLPRLVQR